MKLRSKVFKVFTLLLCLAFVISGCGKTTTPAAGTATPQASSAAPSESPSQQASDVPKDNVTLTFYCVGDSQDMTAIQDAVNAYLKDKLNITLKYECFGWGDTYTPKINPMLAAGDPIDIVFTSNWAANYRTNAVNGYFKPLNDYLAKNPAIEQILGKDFMNATQINGVNYALPCNKEKVHNWGLLLKTDLVKKYGIDVSTIKQLSDLEPYFERVLKEEQGITPLLAVQMDAPWHLLDWNNISDDDIPCLLYTSPSPR
ncbi:MAG: extracellular solute-binding protein, partial [Clostridia bacterium]|nr:extracellular solute-binding protein [Clostridia bacterium]